MMNLVNYEMEVEGGNKYGMIFNINEINGNIVRGTIKYTSSKAVCVNGELVLNGEFNINYADMLEDKAFCIIWDLGCFGKSASVIERKNEFSFNIENENVKVGYSDMLWDFMIEAIQMAFHKCEVAA